MPPRVSIVRKQVTYASSIVRLGHVLEVFFRILARRQREEDHDYAVTARVALVRKQTILTDMKIRQAHNALVLQDLKIEQLNHKLGHDPDREFGPEGSDLPS